MRTPSAASASAISRSRLRSVVRPGRMRSSAAQGAGGCCSAHEDVNMTCRAPDSFTCATKRGTSNASTAFAKSPRRPSASVVHVVQCTPRPSEPASQSAEARG